MQGVMVIEVDLARMLEYSIGRTRVRLHKLLHMYSQIARRRVCNPTSLPRVIERTQLYLNTERAKVKLIIITDELKGCNES
jgi:hypothetical protein